MINAKDLDEVNCVAEILGERDFEIIINTDSRTIKPGETFVALIGDNFDGHAYLEETLKKGAVAVVAKDTEANRENAEILLQRFQSKSVILVHDTLRFIQELADFKIRRWRAGSSERKIIGVTGSNGKTTHKEMLSYLFNKLFPNKVLATKGNLNNHIGVPLTIFCLDESIDIAIIEMGMNHPGEISELTSIAHPEHGMITNVGPAHIEFMKTIENIFLEKSSLYKAVLKNSNGEGIFVVNADDSFLSKLDKSAGLTTYGEENGEVKIKIQGQKVEFKIHGEQVSFEAKNILEHHNLKNLAGTAIFVMKMFPKKVQEIARAAAEYTQPQMNRSEWKENIFLDAYNANPSSMKISLKSFVEVINNKKVSLSDCFFVVGDMNELGEFAESLHGEIAQYLNELQINNVAFIGRYKDFYLAKFKGSAKSYLKKEDFYEEWKQIRKSHKYIFIKASRSLQLESLISIV